MYNGIGGMRRRYRPLIRLKRNEGITLVELLIVSGLASLLALACASVLKYMYSAAISSNLTATRSSMLISLRQFAGDAHTLATSMHMAGNETFLACVCGPSCTTTVYPPGDGVFTLYQPGDAYPKLNPAYYDSLGHPCHSSTSSSCTIQVSTSYVAQCAPNLPSSMPTPASNCTAAEMLGVKFIVQQNPASVGITGAFKTVSSAAYVMVSDIKADPASGCP